MKTCSNFCVLVHINNRAFIERWLRAKGLIVENSTKELSFVGILDIKVR